MGETDIAKIGLGVEQLRLDIEQLNFLISNMSIMQNMQNELIAKSLGSKLSQKDRERWKKESERVSKIIESVIETRTLELKNKEKKMLQDMQVDEIVDNWRHNLMFTCQYKLQADNSGSLSCSITKAPCEYASCPKRP
jgi:hypothetical protein